MQSSIAKDKFVLQMPFKTAFCLFNYYVFIIFYSHLQFCVQYYYIKHYLIKDFKLRHKVSIITKHKKQLV